MTNSIEYHTEMCRRELDEMNYYEGTKKRDACITRHIKEALEERGLLYRTLYVLYGTTQGEGDWWLVAAYPEREMCERHMREAELANKENGRGTGTSYVLDSSFDPKQRQWTDIEYFVEEVKLFVHLDEYLESVGQ